LKLTLKQRFLLSSLIMVGSVSVFFAALLYVTVHMMEASLFGNVMSEQVKWMAQQYEQGNIEELKIPGIWTLERKALTDANASSSPDSTLSAGFHEVIRGERGYHIYIWDKAPYRYELIYDQTDFEEQEHKIFVGTVFAGLAFMAIALIVGRFVFIAAMRPVNQLAEQVRSIDPAGRDQRLASHYSDDVVGELATAFDRQLESLRYYLLQEKLFTGDVSHELRTPLTVIAGAVDLLEQIGQQNIKQASALARIRQSVNHMSRLVDAFLLMSRSDTSENEKRVPVTVNQMVGEMLATSVPELERRNIDFAFDELSLLKVIAIPELVSTVIRNLIQNAVRYTTAGKISITINHNSFVIEDTGPGISDEIIERAFEDYVRVNSSHPSGNGMGLVIIKRICSYNNWELSITAGDSGGSKIALQFPDSQLS